jgi:DNA-nicking Smr family endonuclease
VSPPIVLERRKARRIASGRAEIESRIDLHGLRQAEAHRRLRAFLLAAQAKGLRTVLVITGKGGERSRELATSSGDEARGVIRRLVPLWLEEAELRRLVVSVTQAHARHGGAGALYIQLRTRAAG